jgi:hypothetical protein
MKSTHQCVDRKKFDRYSEVTLSVVVQVAIGVLAVRREACGRAAELERAGRACGLARPARHGRNEDKRRDKSPDAEIPPPQIPLPIYSIQGCSV